MIEKILIANRGEIAVRIIRACREMGIETVAVYSEADKEALHTQLADEAVCIGPAQASESYLNMQNLISAALVSGADAIHPGFGFLSENAKFAELCEQCEITFIGPDSKVIGKMGNKTEARATMIAAGIPVIRGTNGAVLDLEEGKKEAARIGYPVIIKAALGGGGKGMRTAQSEEEFESCFVTARKEAEKAFGDGTMYIEHFVEHPRHIEFQIIADSYGNIVHLGERDCSIQRNHQKMIEECPCAALSDELRKKMGETAVKAARAAGYTNAGTVEFLLEKDGELTFRQEDIRMTGHAIECRINAEIPERNFTPSAGRITDLHLPGGNGIRVDTAVYSGCEVLPYYDSMLAKLIVHGKDRREAVDKMRSALGEIIIEGIGTNVDYQYEISENEDFISGKTDVDFIRRLSSETA